MLSVRVISLNICHFNFLPHFVPKLFFLRMLLVLRRIFNRKTFFPLLNIKSKRVSIELQSFTEKVKPRLRRSIEM